jgi:hypothetical protein
MVMPRIELSGCGTALAYGIAGACIVGFVGFILGFVGPIVFAPEANQGPLLGIFITGPAGAVIGFVAGALYSQLRRPKNDRQHP